MRARSLVIPCTVVISSPALAQPHVHGEHGEAAAPGEHPVHALPLGLAMSRLGSGTAWLPDASPVRGYHVGLAGWQLMIHGNVFAGYDAQGSLQGEAELVSQNWLMVMAHHELAGGQLLARGMLSLEPLTLGKRGYPLLLQSGETADGVPLVDRQHPHDLVMEAALAYDRPIGDDVAIQLYGALSGEPALGPPGFPHRPSAMADPFAPLGHHWQDSTHIAFGVLTAGVYSRRIKLEGSWFNGREPDEERYDLDLRSPDSGAVRLTVNPDAHWSVQASAGYLDSPEVTHPGVSILRTTASMMHARAFGATHWMSTLAWGRNDPSEGTATDSVLLETALDGGRSGVTFARIEYVVKTGEELALGDEMHDARLPIGAFSLGRTQPILREAGLEASLGLRVGVAVIDPDLAPRYGTRTPIGMMAYVQVQPATDRSDPR